MRIAIRNGRIVDPANGVDREGDVFIADGYIISGTQSEFTAERDIDATGQVVCPGLVDLRARLREPGHEHKATIASETRAAAAAGITTLCCPPDTIPVIDTPAVAELIHQRAEQSAKARVVPIGALTPGLAGEQLSEMRALKDAGCPAVSNAEHAITNTRVMRHALEYAASLGLPVMLHSEDPWLATNGAMHEGVLSARLGLAGIPGCAEVIAVGRDLVLIEQTGVRAHFAHLSTARAAEMVAEARARGLPVTADVTAHHLYLTDTDVGEFNTLCHVRPPLRTQRDRDGLRAALADGVISAISSDHQPHDRDAKLAPFGTSEPGISALETLLPLTLRLADEGLLTLIEALGCVTHQPARILGLEVGSLAPGSHADVCVFDPAAIWTVGETSLMSRGKNTPFLGWEMRGKVTYTLLGGRVVHQSP